MRRVGALMNIHANDPQASAETAAFVGTLEKQGWTLGRNLQIEYRWGAGNATLYRKFAADVNICRGREAACVDRPTRNGQRLFKRLV